MRSVLTALCLFASTAHAVPAQFTHQGRLLNADGDAREGDATITFRVTDSESGGTALWEETLTLPLTGGFYAAVLGAEEDNPLDTDVLSQAPVWLELQLEGEGTMFPRSPINAVPYATMATVAEEVSGGPVDASQIAVDGTPVVNELGEWVGPAPTVNWTDIEGMPEDFADGIDDDTDTDTDSFAALGTSCLDGDIPVWDSVLMEWVCGLDAVLTADEVETIVADNGYAMESEVFSSSFLDLTDVPDGLEDGDDLLSESEVDGMVADNGYAMAVDVFSRLFSDLVGIPEDLADGDDVLTEDEVDAMVADNGYSTDTDVDALQSRIETLEAQLTTLEDAVEEATGPSVGTVMYGNYAINNSVDLAALEGFTEVTGNLRIQAGDIPNLSPLSTLTRVGGEIEIAENDALTNLTGLESLESIGDQLNINNNDGLETLDGLDSLATIGDRIYVTSNGALTSLSGLPSLTSTSTVQIYNNPALSSIGLSALETVGSMTVQSNNSLPELGGLDSLTEANELHIYSNNSLATFTGLEPLRSLNSIHASDNHSLTSVDVLYGLTSFGGSYFSIYSNNSLCAEDVDTLFEWVSTTLSPPASGSARWSNNGPC
jgi:hypothetical protein